ncbi:MAG: cysteine--tRNA ligase, partial [Elusimicrobiota bacterium]
MEIKLHNTLTGQKELFSPIQSGKVGLYVCGITPYDEPHLGHARCYVVFDLLKRSLERFGYQVRHIQNFTDVDDKIIDRANQLKEDPLSYPERFIQSFFECMKLLNVKPADEYPRVTKTIPAIVTLVERLIENGLAYESKGTVYYSVRGFPSYGKLSKRKLDELESGARVSIDEQKKDPLDFALWKAAKSGEPSWPSPWGAGRPGWHIECSAMSMGALGETFDIHGGGQDLIFPHHENEIAQSEGASRKNFARFWVHNGFVTINQEKMSKSLKNFFTIREILGEFDPMVVRYYLLSQHYRSPLNFSQVDMKAAESALFQ